MKPFITNADTDNSLFELKAQIDGLTLDDLSKKLSNVRIVGYSFPEGHSFSCAWLFRLYFDDDFLLEFSSTSTDVGNWREVGSINIRMVKKDLPSEYNQEIFNRKPIEPLVVSDIRLLTYDDSNVYAENGIILCTDAGQKIVIVSSVAPGSVSISAPFADEDFVPEFDMSEYKQAPLGCEN